MPIPLPNLDDRTYAELTAEAQAMIPNLNPGWTNHNPSDPGIVLIELLAWLTEMLLFQVNEIPAANTLTFLKLLNGSLDKDWGFPANTDLEKGDLTSVDLTSVDLTKATRQTMRDLRERYRAVTPDDYEYLALHTWPQSKEAKNLKMSEEAKKLKIAVNLRRVCCVSQRNLEETDPAAFSALAPAHMSLVVMPEPAGGEDYPQPITDLKRELYSFFEQRRTLSTRHHIVGPSYVEVGVAANLVLHADAPPIAALYDTAKTLEAFFHPLTGGSDGRGWPFGRDVYTSEVYAVLDQVRLVNYVEDVLLTGPNPISAEGGVIGIKLDAHELVKLRTAGLVVYDMLGKSYRYVEIGVAANLILNADALPDKVLNDVRGALEAFFHPLTGGSDGQGWSFGQGVNVSEVSQVLKQIPLVDDVKDVQFNTSRPINAEDGSVKLDIHELVKLGKIDVVAYDLSNTPHRS